MAADELHGGVDRDVLMPSCRITLCRANCVRASSTTLIKMTGVLGKRS
jgi:hypothetical protein